MSVYVYSTLTADQRYRTAEGDVLINGGANLATRRTLDTPRGVATQITDEQFAALKRDSTSFAKHIENGFVTAEEGKKRDANEVAENLAGKDKSAQLTKKDLMAKSSDPELASVEVGDSKKK